MINKDGVSSIADELHYAEANQKLRPLLYVIGPLLVDSLNTGLIDALKRASVKKMTKIFRFHIFSSISPTERYNHSRNQLTMV